jgi:iron only hydrogenase large subunit-like protein
MFEHGFKIDHEKCRGKLACMRACPTGAIRVKEGKAEVLSDLCIDCGSCLRVCPSGAISPTTRSLKEVKDFRYKVAVPSSILFGHFPMEVTPAHVIEGLKSIGFDSVYAYVVEVALANRAIRDYVEKWKGRYPLISSNCPVIVRLIQVSYPGMIEQLIPIYPPREIAGHEVKLRFSDKLGVPRDDIGVIYITSCQAKTISILESAEGEKSNLDGAIGISDVYNGILTAAYQKQKKENDQKPHPKELLHGLKDYLHGMEMLQWSLAKGQRTNLQGYNYMSLTGLSNVIQVFDDIEKGKLRNIEFLECYACWAGCINGNLTVDNFYVTRTKLHRLMAELPEKDPWVESEVKRRYAEENCYARADIKLRHLRSDMGEIKERIAKIKQAEDILATLPGLNCGLCGAPNCKTLAADIASGKSQKTDCVFFSKDRLEKLRRIHLKPKA